MKLKTHLIYESNYTCFETSLPVYFYGLSNGKILVLFASNTNDLRGNNNFKWIVADHLDFRYDFNTGTILTNGFEKVGIDEFQELADNLIQRTKTIATFGNFLTETETKEYLSYHIYNMLASQNEAIFETNFY